MQTMKASRLCTVHVICLTVSLPLWATITPAQETLPVLAGRTQAAQGSRLIRFANGHLTVKVQDVSLDALIREIARQTGLTVARYGSLNERLSLEFHRLPLEAGLRRILRHRSFAMEYAPSTPTGRPTGPRPKTLWVFAKADEGNPVPVTVVAATKAGSSGEDIATEISRLQAALSSEDEWDREEAVDTLGESGRPEAVAPLRLALADENEDVREAAIIALAEIGGDAAAQALALALHDADPWLREEAVDALGEIGGEIAIGLLEQALADDEESVREAAADMMAQLRNQAQ